MQAFPFAPEALWYQQQQVVMWTHAYVDSALALSESPHFLTPSTSPTRPVGLHGKCSDMGPHERQEVTHEELQEVMHEDAVNTTSVALGSSPGSKEDLQCCDNIMSAVMHFLNGDLFDGIDKDSDSDCDTAVRTLRRPVPDHRGTDDATALQHADRSDIFTEEVWRSLELFLRTNTALPGTVHDAALALRDEDLPHLRDLTTDEFEDVVCLAISQRHLLQYYRGSLRPARVARQLEMWDKKTRQAKDSRRSWSAAKAFAPSTRNAPANLGLDPQTSVPTPVRIADLVGPPGRMASVREDPVMRLARLMTQFPNGVPVSLARRHLQQYQHD